MALNIKNRSVEELASELAVLTGETKTMVIRRALEERKARLSQRQGAPRQQEHLRAFLQREIWPLLANQALITKPEREQILGYGDLGV